MTTELFLTDIDYSSLKQALDYAACKIVDPIAFADLYHNMSYFVPNDILGDKWQTIYFVVDLLQNDYQTILW
jgi:hypothetical protein